MSEDDLCIRVRALVEECETYRNERSVDRQTATEYFDGTMNDVPSDEGRSRVVSRDVRSAIKKALPSIVRTIIGNDKIVEYVPAQEGDEGTAEQATDYVNAIVLPESGGRQAIEDAINDAVRLRNGIIKWWQEEKKDIRVSSHSGLDEVAFADLMKGDDVEALEHTERTEQTPGPDGAMIEAIVHDVRVRRTIQRSVTRMAAIAPENFLIHPDAVRLIDSQIVGEVTTVTRSDLVAMGYERSMVDDLPMASDNSSEQESERDTRRRDEVMGRDTQTTGATQEVQYYELLVRVDFDNDGIAELRRLVFAGGIKEKYMLENEHWDEVYYCDVVCERRPHQWEGNSVPDDVMDIQRIKTVLLRQTLDNLYWQNNLQPVVQEGQVLNPDSIMAPKFGLPIMIRPGTDARQAIAFNPVPMVADKSFAMLNYMDAEIGDRTGISEASAGLAPDALQNMTAKASAMIEQGGIGQTELMVRTIAECLKPVFRGLLKLVIQHQDKPRMVRLRNEWKQFDPRSWNAEMDATVNTGLGAGTRERDMMAMGQVIGLQEKVVAALGADNPFIKPDNLFNAMSKMIESAGLKSVDLYITKPDPEEIKQRMEAAAQQPDPEVVKEQAKAQTQMALKQVDVQGQKEIAVFQAQLKDQEVQRQMVADANKEREQRDADIATNMAQFEREQQNKRDDIEAQMLRDAQQAQLARERLEADMAMNAENIASRERIAMASQMAAEPSMETEAKSPALQAVLEAIQAMAATAAAPKRVIRDASGRVAGVEPIVEQPQFEGTPQ
ncbi:MAG: phage portal protein [Acidobacteria bacterium]|nr:phage portal protein [Acidobacteriota bacterium]